MSDAFKVKYGLSVGESAATIDTSGNIVATGNLTAPALKSASGTTAVTLSGADATVAGNLTLGGNTIKSSAGTTAITLTGADATVAGDLRINGGDLTIAGNGFIYSANDPALQLVGSDVTVIGDLSINGDLTVQGDTVQLNVATLNVEDNAIILNSNVTGTPNLGAALEVERGTETNSSIKWNETQDKWYQNRAGTDTVIAINTDELSEGSTNQYFTNARSRQAISVSDVGGDGSLSYDNSTGVITYTGPSAAEVRAHFTGGTGVSLTDGTIALDFTEFNTSNITEGTNLYYTDSRARQAISVTDAGGDGSVSYNNSTGVITYTGPSASEVRAHFTAGTGVAITDGQISIGQAVSTTSDVQFDDITGGSLTVDNININGNTIISTDTNGNITFTPNGNGDVVTSKNYVRGAIRNATADANGVIWYLNSSTTTAPYTGVSVDNSPNTATQSAIVLRNYTGNTTGASIGNRARVIFEKARNTVASPAALAIGDFMGEISATGYTSTGWVNDLYSVSPGFFGFNAAENWVANTNLGTGFNLALAPTATTINSGADVVNCITINPQTLSFRSDTHAFMQGKTVGFIATGCSISGTTLTIGTVTTGAVAIGQMIQNAGLSINTACYIVSGSGSTWTLNFAPGNQTSQTITGRAGFISTTTGSTAIINNLRLGTNTIVNSANQTQVVLSTNAATLELRADNIQLENAAGTAIKGGQISYRRTFGCFHKVANVTAAAADIVYAFDWTSDTTSHVNTQGVTVSDTSRLNIDAAGDYNVVIEMNAKNTDNADRTAYVWLAKNGVDLPETGIKLVLTKDTSTMLAKDWLVDGIAANDYLEVRFAVDTTVSGISLEYVAGQSSPYTRPAVASATITITPVGA